MDPGRDGPRLDRVDLAADRPGRRRDRGGRRAARRPDRRSPLRARPGGAGGRPAPDRRGRHGLRLLHAVAGPRPAAGRHDRHHRPGYRADRSPASGGARLASPTSGSSQVTAPALEAFAGGGPRAGRPVRPRVHRRAQARVRGLSRRPHRWRPTGRRAPWSSPTTCCGAAGCQAPARRRTTTRNTAALRAFCERVLGDPRFQATILPVGDGLLVAGWRGWTAG